MRGPLFLLSLLAAGFVPAAAFSAPGTRPIRVATFNSSLNRGSPGVLQRDLSTPDNAQARAVAEIIQRVSIGEALTAADRRILKEECGR